MKYQVFDTVSYGHMEPLVPFTKISEHDDLTSAFAKYRELSSQNKDTAFIVLDEAGNIQIDGRTFIYESPDNGQTIYRRRFGMYSEKELVN